MLVRMGMACTFLLGPPQDQQAADVRVGHWIEVKGALGEGGLFVADEVEAMSPDDKEVLIGTVSRAQKDRFWLLGQEVHTSDKTEWVGITLTEVQGARVKVEGHYRGHAHFAARQVRTRGQGRDKIVGRVDELKADGPVLIARVMGLGVVLAEGMDVESERPLAELELAPEREFTDLRRNRDDRIPGSIRLSDTLRFGALLEYRIEQKDNLNLNEDRDRDRTTHRFTASAQLAWMPNDSFLGMFRGRSAYEDEKEQESPKQTHEDSRVSELWGSWRGVGLDGLDFIVGRQRFNDQREWIYDENLDAARLVYSRSGFALELSASTVIADGGDRNEATENFILYASNDDADRHLAFWVADRRDDRGEGDYPIHFGGRALGEWLPQNDSWLEVSLLRGYTGDVDLESYGFDVGTVWQPRWAGPVRFFAGYAFGSGDNDLFDGKDQAYRQTGLHDNNGRLGGVTSFKYYGEVVEPELSNMGIVTAGLGVQVARKSSVDLIYHRYDQDRAQDSLLNTNLRMRPNGIDTELGWGVDVVLGTRAWSGWDFEVIVGMFEPGDAFSDADTAYLGALRARYRF